MKHRAVSNFLVTVNDIYGHGHQVAVTAVVQNTKSAVLNSEHPLMGMSFLPDESIEA